ncbi:MAG: ABC transporter permease [Chloroflexi bacterium]|nr:ABC transporter permease [Chloroflexota bacterium]
MINTNKSGGKRSFISIFYEELSNSSLTIIILSIISGFIMGGILVILTSPEVYKAFGTSFVTGLAASWKIVANTYSSLFLGAFGDPVKISAAFKSGDQALIYKAITPFFDSLVVTTPYLFTGVAVALGFRAGLFNIGAEGQVLVGTIAAGWAGWTFTGLSPWIHVPLAILIGALAGALWGFIPGLLKVKTGAHEVITTIMMNYVAYYLIYYLISAPLRDPKEVTPKTPMILESAHLFRFFPDPIRFHLGFFVAIGVAVLVWFILFKTIWGYEIRSVGLNSSAAKYAGMNITNITVASMSLSGAIAGMAGASEILGVTWRQSQALSSGYGFDSIALALLAQNHPLGVILTALLFGFLRSGSRVMQVRAGVPIYIINILQSFIILFIAAPAIIRTIYRLKEPTIKEVSTPPVSLSERK